MLSSARSLGKYTKYLPSFLRNSLPFPSLTIASNRLIEQLMHKRKNQYLSLSSVEKVWMNLICSQTYLEPNGNVGRNYRWRLVLALSATISMLKITSYYKNIVRYSHSMVAGGLWVTS
jgi:hypothetical protein